MSLLLLTIYIKKIAGKTATGENGRLLAGRTVSARYGPAGGSMGGLSGQGSPHGTGGPGQPASAAVSDVWRRGWACHSRSAPELRGPQLARTGASKCSRRVLELVNGLAVRNLERGRRFSQPCLPQAEWRSTVTSARRPAPPSPGLSARCARHLRAPRIRRARRARACVARARVFCVGDASPGRGIPISLCCCRPSLNPSRLELNRSAREQAGRL